LDGRFKEWVGELPLRRVRPGSGAAPAQLFEGGGCLVLGCLHPGDRRLDPVEDSPQLRLLVGADGRFGGDPLAQLELVDPALHEGEIDAVELVLDPLQRVAHDASPPTTEAAHASLRSPMMRVTSSSGSGSLDRLAST